MIDGDLSSYRRVIKYFNMTVSYYPSAEKIQPMKGAFTKLNLMHIGTNPDFHSLT